MKCARRASVWSLSSAQNEVPLFSRPADSEGRCNVANTSRPLSRLPATEYRACTDNGDVVMRIGEPMEVLAGLLARRGVGAFSGTDSTKVDRSAAYAARQLALSVVKAQITEACEVRLAYASGHPAPVAVGMAMDGMRNERPTILDEAALRYPIGGDLSCAMVAGGWALRWDRYWGVHRCY